MPADRPMHLLRIRVPESDRMEDRLCTARPQDILPLLAPDHTALFGSKTAAETAAALKLEEMLGFVPDIRFRTLRREGAAVFDLDSCSGHLQHAACLNCAGIGPVSLFIDELIPVHTMAPNPGTSFFLCRWRWLRGSPAEESLILFETQREAERCMTDWADTCIRPADPRMEQIAVTGFRGGTPLHTFADGRSCRLLRRTDRQDTWYAVVLELKKIM